MKYVLRLCVLAVAMMMAIPGLARAADMDSVFSSSGIKPYIGLGVGVYDAKVSLPGFIQNNNMVGGVFRLGVDFNDYLGAELRVGASDRGRTIYGGYPIPGGMVLYVVDQRVTYMFSYLGKLQYPLTQELTVYGLAGGTTGKVSVRGSLQYGGKLATGVSYGGGLDYKVDDFMHIGLEYMSYWNNVGIDKISVSPYPAKENVEAYTATLRIDM